MSTATHRSEVKKGNKQCETTNKRISEWPSMYVASLGCSVPWCKEGIARKVPGNAGKGVTASLELSVWLTRDEEGCIYRRK